VLTVDCLNDPQSSNANCVDKTVDTDQYVLQITVGGVGGCDLVKPLWVRSPQ